MIQVMDLSARLFGPFLFLLPPFLSHRRAIWTAVSQLSLLHPLVHHPTQEPAPALWPPSHHHMHRSWIPPPKGERGRHLPVESVRSLLARQGPNVCEMLGSRRELMSNVGERGILGGLGPIRRLSSSFWSYR